VEENLDKFMVFLALQLQKEEGGENFTLNCNKCRDSGPQSEIATQILEKLYTGGEFPRIYGS
jgi:hypothetical protein